MNNGWISGIILIVHCYGASLQAPFPTAFTFPNCSGWVLDCQVGGEPPPKTIWITQEGATVSSYPGILSLIYNGSLHSHKFSAERWRSTYIRCKSSKVFLSTLIHVKGGKWPLDKANLCSIITVQVFKMQTSKNKDSESSLYTPGQTMQQTLMWEGNKQIIIIVLRENKKNNSNLILFIILVIEETLVIKVIGDSVLKLNTGILKC